MRMGQCSIAQRQDRSSPRHDWTPGARGATRSGTGRWQSTRRGRRPPAAPAPRRPPRRTFRGKTARARAHRCAQGVLAPRGFLPAPLATRVPPRRPGAPTLVDRLVRAGPEQPVVAGEAPRGVPRSFHDIVVVHARPMERVRRWSATKWTAVLFFQPKCNGPAAASRFARPPAAQCRWGDGPGCLVPGRTGRGQARCRAERGRAAR